MEGYVQIAPERYEQLIRAEHDANQLKALFEDAHDNFNPIDRDAIVTIYRLYFGNKEESKV